MPFSQLIFIPNQAMKLMIPRLTPSACDRPIVTQSVCTQCHNFKIILSEYLGKNT